MTVSKITPVSLLTYVNAGYNAYRMAYSNGYFGFEARPQLPKNPYLGTPYLKLWDRGWMTAQREVERGGTGAAFRYQPFKNHTSILQYVHDTAALMNGKTIVSAKKSFQKPFKGKPTQKLVQKLTQQAAPTQKQSQKPFKGGFTPKPKDFTPAAPINLKRIEKFNNKHRTVA